MEYSQFARRIMGEKGEIAAVRSLVRNVSGVIDLGYGDIDWNTPSGIKDAAKRAMDENFTKYTATEGIPELCSAIARKLAEENEITVDPKTEVLVTAGGMEAIHVAIMAFINSGDEVIVSNPHYMNYPLNIRYAGGTPVLVQVKEERDFRIDPEDIEGNITRKTKAIVLVSPDNPTGSVLTKDDLEAVAEISKRHDLIVIADEIYEKFVYDGNKHFSIASFPGMKERTITINGFSKVYAMTGWRLGYVAAHEDLIKPLKAIHNLALACAPSISQKAGLEALRGPQDFASEIVEEYKERRDIMVDGLNRIMGIECRKPAGSIYVYPNIKGLGVSSYDFALRLAKESKVLTYPGTAFGSGGEGYLRLSCSTSKENLKEGTERIKSFVEKHT